MAAFRKWNVVFTKQCEVELKSGISFAQSARIHGFGIADLLDKEDSFNWIVLKGIASQALSRVFAVGGYSYFWGVQAK